MNLLRLITLPYIRRHALRTLLTLAGITLGVAVFVAMQAANQSVLYGFRNTVERIAGRAQLQVSAGEAGFEEDVLERVRSLPEVAKAAPLIEAIVQTGLEGEGNLLVLAVDMVGDAGVRDYSLEGAAEESIDDPLVFLAQPDSLILSSDFAQRNGLESNSKLSMQTMDGLKVFTVRGLLSPSGMSSAYGGNLAIMDVYAAQSVFGRGRRFDRVDVVVADGVSVEIAQEKLRQTLGPAFAVEPPQQRSQNFEALLAGYSAAINVSSVFALFIGMFVVYNSFATAVSQRRTEIGTLRALGASRGQIRNLFLLESAAAGTIGAAAGIGIGLAAAQLLVGFSAEVAKALAGSEHASGDTIVSGQVLFVAAAMGLATTMLAAWVPAREAAQTEPVLALQKGKVLAIPVAESRNRFRLALVAMPVSSACFFWGAGILFYFGFMLVALTAVLLAPTLSLWFARALRTPLRLLRPVEGMLAADSLIHAPRRTSATVAALMLSLAIAIIVAGIARATASSLEEWVNAAFNADLLVSTTESLSSRSFQFPGAMQAQLESMSGIAEVQPVRSVRLPLGGRPVMIIAADMAKAARLNPSQRVIAGNPTEMYRIVGAGKGLLASENLVLSQGIELGDVVEFSTPSGVLELPVVGVIRDFINQTGSIYMELSVFRQYWRDDTLDLIYVYLDPGVDPEDAKRRIQSRFESERRLFVFLNRDLRAFVMNIGSQWFGLTYVQIAVAIFVAVLGIVNTLTVSIIDRRRELGVLRAVGGLRRQIRGTLWLEAMAMAFMGVVLGLALGGIGLFYQIETLRRSILAMPLDYVFPLRLALALFPLMLAVAFISALVPAESAIRASLVEALEYE